MDFPLQQVTVTRSRRSTSRLAIFPRVVMAMFFIGISLGLLGTWLPAFGFLPVIGKTSLGISAWRELFNYPGLGKSILATLISGGGATLLAVLLSLLIVTFSYGGSAWRFFEKNLASMLSIPHAAFAIGFGFLIAPSGWLLRIVSPALTGFQTAPDWIITKDPYGISLMITLCLKETPFLLLIIISALSRLRVEDTLRVGRSLGYQPVQIWIKIIIPQLYPHIRLSVFAVIAYSLSTVDVALIIGPTLPPTLGVLILKWFNDPDLGLRLVGAAGATFLLLMVALAIGLAWISEKVCLRVIARVVSNGGRKSVLTVLRPISAVIISGKLFFTLGSFLVLVIWSFTWRWRFPEILPSAWRLRFWIKGLDQASWPLINTVSIGLVSTIIAEILVIGCLEYEVFLKKTGRNIKWDKILWIAYLPLIIPQIAFIFGAQVALIVLKLDGLWLSLVWSHLLFVYPYVFLTLSNTYRDFDERNTDLAAILSGSKWKAFRAIKLPMLTRPLLFSFAVGFSVSVSQYIPTVFIGAGRFVTITTETVNLASGSDRRIIAVLALCQQLTPFILFLLAIVTPKILFLHRKEMRV